MVHKLSELLRKARFTYIFLNHSNFVSVHIKIYYSTVKERKKENHFAVSPFKKSISFCFGKMAFCCISPISYISNGPFRFSVSDSIHLRYQFRFWFRVNRHKTNDALWINNGFTLLSLLSSFLFCIKNTQSNCIEFSFEIYKM